MLSTPFAVDEALLGGPIRSACYRNEWCPVSMCSKTIRASILHDHVVTSALLSGGQARRTANQVVRMALPHNTGSDGPSRASIHLPTPMRLLRLVNGTRCESRACSSAETTICPHFGLFLCWECFLGATTEIDLKHEALVNEKRIARLYRRKAHGFKSPFRDATGEIAGPVISWDVASGATANEEVEDLLKQADQAWPLETHERIRQSFRDNSAREASRHQEGISLAETMLLMNRLQSMLEDMHCPYSDVLCSFNELQEQPPDSSGVYPSNVVFHSSMVDELVDVLTSHLIASSQTRATESQLQEIADELSQAMEMLIETDFLDFSFLDENNPWENALQQHFRQQTQPHFALRSINGDMLEDIGNGDLFDAMQHLQNYYSTKPPNDPDRPMGNWADVFADVVLTQNANAIRQYRLITETCARDLAKITYIDLVANPSPALEDAAFDDDGDDEEEGDNDRAEFTRRCDLAALAFQELLPLTEVLIVFIHALFAYVEALIGARIDPTGRSRQACVNFITAKIGKLRGNVVARFRNELLTHRLQPSLLVTAVPVSVMTTSP
ncbi:hypothetical protein MHU86_18404 [Fragilaria crotonensis]|nr:hypothetical protein MHU86_18404 [Fragilaria crotonensis]